MNEGIFEALCPICGRDRGVHFCRGGMDPWGNRIDPHLDGDANWWANVYPWRRHVLETWHRGEPFPSFWGRP